MLKHLLLVATLPAVYAGIDAKLVGEWVANPAGGSPVHLKIAADGRCSVNADSGKCQSALRLLVVQVGNAPATTYSYQVKNEKLTVGGGGLQQILVFEHATAEPTPLAAAAAPAAPTPSIPAPNPPSAVASAGRFAHPFWGISFAVPGAWKTNERDGLLLLGSDTEAGLMIIRFVPQTTRQALLQSYSEGLTEEGVSMSPASRAEEYASGQLRGLAGELAGMSRDGQRLRARVIALQTPYGDAAVLLGLTTQEKYTGLKARVEEMASTFAFTQPKLPPVTQTISGNYYYIFVSKGGAPTYSREDKLMLCGNGMFQRGGEMYGNNGAGMAGVHNANAGSWTADGDGSNGTITLIYRNGQRESMRYQKSGPDIILNGKKYGRNGNAVCGGR